MKTPVQAANEMRRYAVDAVEERKEADALLKLFKDAGFADSPNGMLKTVKSPTGGKDLRIVGGYDHDFGDHYFVSFEGSGTLRFSTAKEAIQFSDEVIADLN